ncbi:MAG TPA: hypothetical protein VFH59_09835 [Frateuria sp.]|uniref:energy transducer TonB n=1 Tax=Frateuria sp. TaxID=2211372 RepID=UPI002D7FA359|nr:hypothetical protein [Frateuria sp.]HET6805727.1 hypothetical protein [Frateuria sp.]
MSRAITLLAAATLLAGCAHAARKPATEPGVGGAGTDRIAVSTGMAHYQLAMGQVATGATLEAHQPPAYPEAMLTSCPSRVDMPARVIVDARGHVDEVRMNPPEAQSPFADAVRDAVRDWRYTPLTVTYWAADADGNSHPVDSEAKPFGLDYVFTFRCEHGRTSVSAGPGAAAR